MIEENIWFADGDPKLACIYMEFEPGDWSAISRSDQWKAFLQYLADYESINNLPYHLIGKDLSEKPMIDKVLLDARLQLEKECCGTSQCPRLKNMGSGRHPIRQRFLKWILRSANCL